MDMPMSSGSHSKIEIITGVQRRRRWTPEQKLAWVRRTSEPGMSVSLVAREAGPRKSKSYHENTFANIILFEGCRYFDANSLLI